MQDRVGHSPQGIRYMRLIVKNNKKDDFDRDLNGFQDSPRFQDPGDNVILKRGNHLNNYRKGPYTYRLQSLVKIQPKFMKTSFETIVDDPLRILDRR